ncbi:DUF3017 domain-containing protein [Nocardioides sp. C4-1]|uniref:DUF3017 domain-containing protein n=1 Tax=Nocardioides sp. C4-1 TaxID=3151851 RepID=UPI0032659DFC
MTDPEPIDPLDPVQPGEPVDDPRDADPLVDDPDGPRRYPSTVGGALYIAVLLTAVTAIGIVATGDWRVGVRVLAGALAAGATFRLVLPRRDAGMLAVRGRFFDAVLLAGIAALLWWLAGSIPDQPSP